MLFLPLRRNLIQKTLGLIGFAALFCAVSATASAPAMEHVVAIEGTQLQLSSSGKAVFAEVVFPDQALAERWFSKNLLQQMIDVLPRGEDRYGRLRIASALQLRMLREGVAVTYSPEKIAPDLLLAEAQARQAKRGVWRNESWFATPDTAAQHLQQFTFVQGAITKIYHARDASYVNFGENWKTDFSVKIPRKYRRSFTALDALQPGNVVRVRGVVIAQEGTMMIVTRPEQLEKF